MTLMHRDPKSRNTEMTADERATWHERQLTLAAELKARRLAAEADLRARQMDLDLPIAPAPAQRCLHVLAGAPVVSWDDHHWLCDACTPRQPARRGRRR